MNAPLKEVIPSSYVIRTTYTLCVCCGHNSASSEFLALSFLRSRMGAQPVKHYEAVSRPLYNLPVTHTSTQRTTAMCLRCHSIDLSHLPLPPNAARLYDLPEPILKTAPRPAAKPATQKPSLKDLA